MGRRGVVRAAGTAIAFLPTPEERLHGRVQRPEASFFRHDGASQKFKTLTCRRMSRSRNESMTWASLSTVERTMNGSGSMKLEPQVRKVCLNAASSDPIFMSPGEPAVGRMAKSASGRGELLLRAKAWAFANSTTRYMSIVGAAAAVPEERQCRRSNLPAA